MRNIMRLLALLLFFTANAYAANTLMPGQVIYPGQFISSDNNSARFGIDPDNHYLVFYGSSSEERYVIVEAAGDRLVMQQDGDLVFYAGSQALWSSSLWFRREIGFPGGTQGAYVVAENFGNMSMYSPAGNVMVTWPDTAILPGASAVSIPHGESLCNIQVIPSGPFQYKVLFSNFEAQWYMYGPTADRFTMQPDGNLVLYDRSNNVVWSSGTSGHSGALAISTCSGFSIVNPRGGVVATVAYPVSGNHMHMPTQQAIEPTGDYPNKLNIGGSIVLNFSACYAPIGGLGDVAKIVCLP